MNKIDELKLGDQVRELAAQGHSSESISETLKNEGHEISHMSIYRYLHGSEEVQQEVNRMGEEIAEENRAKDAQRDQEYGQRTLEQVRDLDRIIGIAEAHLKREEIYAEVPRSQGRLPGVYEALKTLQYFMEKRGKLLRALKPDIYAEYRKSINEASK